MTVDTGGVAETLNAVAEAYATNDAEAVLSHFADDARVIGSLRHEDWGSKDEWADYLRRELEDFHELEFRHPALEGDQFQPLVETDSFAVVTQRVAVNGRFRGRLFAHDGTWTCALRYQDGRWKIVLSHFSLALS